MCTFLGEERVHTQTERKMETVERGEMEKRNRIVSGCRSVISGFVENETKNEFHAGKSSSSGIMSRAE